LQRAEVFGYGVTVGVILLVVVVLDPAKRLLIPRLLLMVYGAGLAADGIKLLLARTRPRDFQFTGTIWNSFGKLLPLGHGGSSQHSFPSAHTATAVALAVTLAALYPRGRWLFGVFAALVGCQRIVSGAHFASDVFWGASLGWLVAVGVGRANLDWVPRRSHEDDAPPAGSEGSG
jgi:membrane-associated phospholipid phosphatase